MIFSGDECSVSLEIKGSKIWSRIGTKPLFPTTTRKGEVKVFGALNNKNGKVLTLTSNKINQYIFIKFLKKLLRYYKKVFLVVDNASWHKAKKVNEFLEENNHRLQINYFPRYSPEYNPSEQCWKALKRDLLTTKLFVSTEGMKDEVQTYFNEKHFFWS